MGDINLKKASKMADDYTEFYLNYTRDVLEEE